jgi:hypothetical protein
MAVICKKCGGAHPLWECTASAAKVAAYEKSKFDRGPFPRVDIEAGPDLKISYVAKRKVPKAERLAVVKEVAQKLADQGEVVTVVDKIKRPRGRPAKIVDMRAYKREKQAEYRRRAAAKEKSK